MEFSQPKGIYQQIADQMRDRILAGEWHEGERIPSVRELAVGVGVNPNTVTKSYQACSTGKSSRTNAASVTSSPPTPGGALSTK